MPALIGDLMVKVQFYLETRTISSKMNICEWRQKLFKHNTVITILIQDNIFLMGLIKDLIPKTEMLRNIWDINVVQSCNIMRKFSAQNVNTGHYFAAFTLQCRKKNLPRNYFKDFNRNYIQFQQKQWTEKYSNIYFLII